MKNRYQRARDLTKDFVHKATATRDPDTPDITAPHTTQPTTKQKKNFFLRVSLRVLINFVRLILVLLFLFGVGLLNK